MGGFLLVVFCFLYLVLSIYEGKTLCAIYQKFGDQKGFGFIKEMALVSVVMMVTMIIPSILWFFTLKLFGINPNSATGNMGIFWVLYMQILTTLIAAVMQ